MKKDDLPKGLTIQEKIFLESLLVLTQTISSKYSSDYKKNSVFVHFYILDSKEATIYFNENKNLIEFFKKDGYRFKDPGIRPCRYSVRLNMSECEKVIEGIGLLEKESSNEMKQITNNSSSFWNKKVILASSAVVALATMALSYKKGP